ncbi:hypothetical protein PLICRDRAFT_38708 [Plicaturopsis crispa FD-325 SS-3]|nr:hypothetical protein PLICRDRAFT_38708 [Plicaturopsis crispa FD-325 SS-3]
MPGLIRNFTCTVYRNVRNLPPAVWEAFASHPGDANIMYAHAQSKKASQPDPRDVWITCVNNQTSPPQLKYVLSCTEGPLGAYPVFIFTTMSPAQLKPRDTTQAVAELAQTLLTAVHPARVFAVFAPSVITQLFAHSWSHITKIRNLISQPYYSARFTYCTAATLTYQHSPAGPELRLAQSSDISEAAELCFGFAADSQPYILTRDAAVAEATYLVRSGYLYVCRVHPRAPIACIVAVTRETQEVAAITKVYTHPNWRQRGLAGRLVGFVCAHLLHTKRKQSVVLYVAHDNAAAAKVYRRIGFAGLANGDEQGNGVSDWLEVGFDRTVVTLGHW